MPADLGTGSSTHSGGFGRRSRNSKSPSGFQGYSHALGLRRFPRTMEAAQELVGPDLEVEDLGSPSRPAVDHAPATARTREPAMLACFAFARANLGAGMPTREHIINEIRRVAEKRGHWS